MWADLNWQRYWVNLWVLLLISPNSAPVDHTIEPAPVILESLYLSMLCQMQKSFCAKWHVRLSSYLTVQEVSLTLHLNFIARSKGKHTHTKNYQGREGKGLPAKYRSASYSWNRTGWLEHVSRLGPNRMTRLSCSETSIWNRPLLCVNSVPTCQRRGYK
jgi:hypothetical protein